MSSSDRHGQTALHLTASTEGGGVQAKKVVSLLLKNGGDASNKEYSSHHVCKLINRLSGP